MTLDDAALRKRLAADWCRSHAIVPNGTLAADLAETLSTYGDAVRAEQREQIEELERQILELKLVEPHRHTFSFSSGNTGNELPRPDVTCICGITYAAAIRAQGGAGHE